MTGNAFLKFLMILILSGVLGWCVFTRYDEEIGSEEGNTGKQRYLPYLNGTVLPILPLSLFCVAAIFYGPKEAFHSIIPICLSIFLHISIYYILLLPFLKLLRKYISARACAALWLLPNYTYLVYCNSIMASARPRLVLRIPGALSDVLLYIWLAGFFIVLGGSIIQHISFRRKILLDSTPVCDPDILEIWKQELDNARIKNPKYELIQSPHIATPLSFGFTNKGTRVVLPCREYTDEELSLIFRHEIIHICRTDSGNKFSLIFCCAMCWFNPLMWWAMRKSADDLELSCDETVLIDADDTVRRMYANLILTTAADNRGFTTCLSASKAALRYRLKSIMHKHHKSSGWLIVALICFLVYISFGSVTVSCGDYSGDEIIGVQTLSDCKLNGVSTSFDYDNGLIICSDEAALMQYLGGLELSRINGNYTLDQFDREISLFCSSPDSEFCIHLSDQILEIIDFSEKHNPLVFYHVRNKVDWDYLYDLFSPIYIQDPELGFPPILQISPSPSSTLYNYGIIQILTKDGEVRAEDVNFSPYALVDIQDSETKEVRFSFTHEPSLPFQVKILDRTETEIDTITYDYHSATYPLPVYNDASYQCFVTFTDENTVLEMEYPFVMHYFTE